MSWSVRLRRLFYRSAFLILRTYWFFRRPRKQGVKCVLSIGDQVLLVRHTYGEWVWDLPGGSVRRGEAPVVTARREIEEELGVRVEDWVSLGHLPATLHHRHDILHCFQADLFDPPITIDRGELAAARWFRRDELPPDLARFVRPVVGRWDALTESSRP